MSHLINSKYNEQSANISYINKIEKWWSGTGTRFIGLHNFLPRCRFVLKSVWNTNLCTNYNVYKSTATHT